MYPIIKWVFTLVNIGSQQQAGYHMVKAEKLFTPGFGGSGIFIPVFAQEAVYVFNIALSTKPQITGWYVGSTSQSTSGPRLVSQSNTPPQLTSIQQTVNTIQQQASFTLPNITRTTTYWNYNNGGGNTNINIVTYYTGSPPNNTSTQPTTGQESWVQFWRVGPYGPNSAGQLGNSIVKYNNTGGPITTYNTTVAKSYQQVWNQSAQVWSSAFQSLGNAISNVLGVIGGVLTNIVTVPISTLTGFANTNTIANTIAKAVGNSINTITKTVGKWLPW